MVLTASQNLREIQGVGYDIKLILKVEKHRELYDPQKLFYKDNVEKDQCWDAVGAAVGITRFLKISYAMFTHHVSEKGKLRVAERLGDRRGEMRVWCEQLLLSRSRSWRCAAHPGASQPVCPRR